jgi:methyl-accepting chemotaxis protein
MLDSMRFDGDNYLFVLDEDRRVVVHPAKPELVGQQMGNNPAESHWQHMVDLGKGGHTGQAGVSVGLPVRRGGQKMSLVTGYQPGAGSWAPVCCCRTLRPPCGPNMSGWVAPPCW